MVKPSKYVPKGKSLELLALALNTYGQDPKYQEELDTKTVEQFALEWAAAAQRSKLGQDPQHLIEMAERAHLFILGILRDTTLVTSAHFVRAMGLHAEKSAHDLKAAAAQEASEEEERPEVQVNPELQERVSASIRSCMEPGYNLERFVKEYTEKGEELRMTEEDWKTFTRPFGENVACVKAWYGAKNYEIHWRGEQLPVYVEVSESETVQ